jgi:hypothetical protein
MGLFQLRYFVLYVCGSRLAFFDEFRSVLAKRLELIDELVNDVVQPLDGQFELQRTFGTQYRVEQVNVVFV